MKGTRLSAAVMFVRNLDKSLSFYRELLGLEIADQSSTAARLDSADGWQLVLRAFGENAPHSLGTIGVQYLLWTTASKADLDACEAVLRRLSAYRETRSAGQDVSLVEGRDPDDLVVMLVYAADGKPPLRELLKPGSMPGRDLRLPPASPAVPQHPRLVATPPLGRSACG